MTIQSLGYMGFSVQDPGAFGAFAENVLGVSPVGASRYRLDDQVWRLSVEAGEADDLAFVGLEVAGPDALVEIAARLTAAGVDVGKPDPDVAIDRAVEDLIVCQDPGGLTVEIYHGARQGESPAPAGFVTGEQGLGHVVLATAHMDASRRFWRDLLGFKLSDIIALDIGRGHRLEMEFLHCNARHHTVALVPAPAPKRMHHFMLQVESLDAVGHGLERAQAAGAPITSTLGRHTNDLMLSFYARTPAGFEVEYGWGARTVDDATWEIGRYDATSLWGHKHG
jgi:biphenyl-2,3-diol 1,2-dioxygenase